MDDLPKYQELIPSILRVLASVDGSISNSEIENAVREALGLSNEACSRIHSGSRTEFQYRLAWARTKAKSEGLVCSPKREHWQITELGKSKSVKLFRWILILMRNGSSSEQRQLGARLRSIR